MCPCSTQGTMFTKASPMRRTDSPSRLSRNGRLFWHPTGLMAWQAPKALAGPGYSAGAKDGPGDAIRHCVWQCLLAKAFGEKAAEAVGNVHEAFGMKAAESKAAEKRAEASVAAARGDSAGADAASAAADQMIFDATESMKMDQWNNSEGRECQYEPDCLDCCLSKINRGALLNKSGGNKWIGPEPCELKRRRRPVTGN